MEEVNGQELTVLKFLDIPSTEYDIGRSKWLFNYDPQTCFGDTYWPPLDSQVKKYVIRDQVAEPLTWRIFRVKVKRFKATYEAAVEYLNGILNHSSNYETETSFGKGRRKRIAKKLTDSESDEPQKKILKKKPVAAAPPLKNIILPTKQKVSCSLEQQKNKKEVVRVQKHAAKAANATVKADSSRKLLLEKLGKTNSSATLPKGSCLKSQSESISSKEQLSVKITEAKSVATPSKGSCLKSQSESISSKELLSVKLREAKSLATSSKSSCLKSQSESGSSKELLSVKLREAKSLATSSKSSCLKSQSESGSSKELLSVKLREAKSVATSSKSSCLNSQLESTLNTGNTGNGEDPENCTFMHKEPEISEVTVPQSPKDRDHLINEENESVISTPSQSPRDRDYLINEETGSVISTPSQLRVYELSLAQHNSDGDNERKKDGTDSIPGSSIFSKSPSHHSNSPFKKISSNVTGSPQRSPQSPRTPPMQGKENSSISRNVHDARRESGGFSWIEQDLLKMRKEVELTRADVQEVNFNVARLVRHLMPHEKKLKLPPNMPTLPLKDFDQFDAFENFLKNRVNVDAVMEYLSLLPNGQKESSAAMKLMAKVMSNGLASAFNYDGHGWKLAFKKTRTWKVVEGALAIQFGGSTLEEAIGGVRSWLRNAPQREGGKPATAFTKE